MFQSSCVLRARRTNLPPLDVHFKSAEDPSRSEIFRMEGSVPADTSAVRKRLLLESANISNQSLGFVITELIAVRIHLLLSFLDDPFFDHFGRLLIGHLGLYLRIGIIFYAALPPHAGVSFAIGTMAFLTMFLPVLFHIRSQGGTGAKRSSQKSH